MNFYIMQSVINKLETIARSFACSTAARIIISLKRSDDVDTTSSKLSLLLSKLLHRVVPSSSRATHKTTTFNLFFLFC